MPLSQEQNDMLEESFRLGPLLVTTHTPEGHAVIAIAIETVAAVRIAEALSHLLTDGEKKAGVYFSVAPFPYKMDGDVIQQLMRVIAQADEIPNILREFHPEK